MDFNPEIPTVDPNAATDMHPLDYLQQLASQANQAPMPNVPSLPQAKPTETSGDGWRGLLHMFAPVIGALAVGGGGPKQTGFMNGYSEGQQAVEADKQRKAQEAQRKSAIASDFMLRISDQAQSITDPVAFQKFADLADAAFVKAGYGQPGEIKNQLSFNTNSLAKKQLKELTDQLDSLGKSGYSLDDLASSGAVLKLSTGQSVPIGVAMDVTRARPLTGGGQPIAKPTKAAATAEERYLQKWAKENGLKVEDLTSAQELEARKQFLDVGRAEPRPRVTATGGVDAQFNDLVELWKTGHPGQEPPADVRTKLRKQANDVNDRPQMLGGMNALYSQSDPKAIAAAIIRGEREPETGSLGRPIGAAVDTELAKAGYNKAAAITDWKATQRHVATMNGPQQLRLNQAINSLPDMLDTVDTLAAKWKGGRFPLLNKASLALAKGGTYGRDAASIANQLDTQIADVTSDLGVVYMGGNSPTDHALGLAATGLKGEWDERVLHDMVNLARKNVTVRRNSVLNTGVSGASPNNPYAPPPATSTPASGKTYQLVNGKWVLQ